MSYNDDHLRLMTGAGLRSLSRGEAAGVRARPRTTDWNAVFDKVGLSGRARRA
ncbi:MAG: hypothetical protein ACOC0V_02790 [Oceanicaulis sp.]